ncbi:preprotein translocase subunit YajC [Campylobacter fetus subsp. fetus]|nr:preprotein translocase subunit YajC [Campylobacter fetus subsp. fetus]QYA64829.1 preprotein translocase subunit YajC [Campylobacter fetus subsp. fetus]SQH30058.1 preprotein translocase subunit YajC [Campylobacter fetus subsp. fetus]
MLSNLQKGDKIVTNGGLFCEVVKPEDDFIKVKLNDEVIVRIDRNFVAKKIDKIEKSDA